MRSFTYIASFAALAFSTLTSAVPVQTGETAAITSEVAAEVAAAVEVGAAGLTSLDLERRHNQEDSHSIPEILQWVINDATPLCKKLTTISKKECSVEVVTGISVQLIALFDVAIGKCNKLIGQPLEIVLRGGLEITVVAKLLASLLTLVFTALHAVIKISASVAGSQLFTLCVNIGLSCGQLVQACILVSATVSNVSLIAALAPLCVNILPIINIFQLNVLGGLIAGVAVKGTLLGSLIGGVCGVVGGVVKVGGGIVGGILSGGAKLGAGGCTKCA